MMSNLKGIDISHWNSITDFCDLAYDNDFIIVKCGGGDDGIYTDSKFKTYWREACMHFKLRGLYWYVGSTTETGVINEVSSFIAQVKKFENEWACYATLPLFLDVETKTQYKNTNIQTAIRKGLTTLEKAGYFAGLYTYRNFYDTKFDKDFNKRFYTWIADYRTNAANNYAGTNFGMCQYGQSNEIGVTGKVDANVMYKNPADNIRKKSLNHLKLALDN